MKPKLLAYGALALATAPLAALASDKSTITVKGSDTLVILAQKWAEVYMANYVNPALDQGEVSAYLSWIRSDDGQKLVKDIGFFPLLAHLREK